MLQWNSINGCFEMHWSSNVKPWTLDITWNKKLRYCNCLRGSLHSSVVSSLIESTFVFTDCIFWLLGNFKYSVTFHDNYLPQKVQQYLVFEAYVIIYRFPSMYFWFSIRGPRLKSEGFDLIWHFLFWSYRRNFINPIVGHTGKVKSTGWSPSGSDGLQFPSFWLTVFVAANWGWVKCMLIYVYFQWYYELITAFTESIYIFLC